MLGDKAWARKFAHCPPLNASGFLAALFQHFGIQIYAVVAITTAVYVAFADAAPLRLAIAGVYSFAAFSFIEYGLHRYILHANFLARSRWTATLWRRLHYDHHMAPGDVSVLFADPTSSVPFLVLLSLVMAGVVGNLDLFLPLVATNFAAFLYYEFMHAVAHVPGDFGNAWLRRKKENHLRHHFLDEQVNFGIGSNLVDRLVGTLLISTEGKSRSPTARNLGYDDEMAARYPWVREGYLREFGADGRRNVADA